MERKNALKKYTEEEKAAVFAYGHLSPFGGPRPGGDDVSGCDAQPAGDAGPAHALGPQPQGLAPGGLGVAGVPPVLAAPRDPALGHVELPGLGLAAPLAQALPAGVAGHPRECGIREPACAQVGQDPLPVLFRVHLGSFLG